MALAKSFSVRRGKKEYDPVKQSRVTKLQISSPVELLSTTNMITYTAPSLPQTPSTPLPAGVFSPVSSGSSAGSSISDMEPASPPISPTKPQHLSSSYFAIPPVPPPMSPARSASIRSNAALKRSASSSSSTVASPPNSTSKPQRKSQGAPPRSSIHRGIRNSNPFGAELAKVSELAEDYGLNVHDVEEEYMYLHGLQKHRASEYLQDITELGYKIFEDDDLPIMMNPGWI